MTEINFKGKEFVYNHHLSVPFRPLVPDPDKGIGEPALDGNLIIRGDNLHALKALLPLYSSKIDCVFIDPPYNTGNEGWCYNDNVNAPMIREWLNANPIGIEDGLRHDKWCAMIWPRVRLLHELLADTGSFWMTVDGNEIQRALAILCEVFGEQNFVTVCIWRKNYSPKPSGKYFSEDHDYIIVFAKTKEVWRPNLLGRTEEMDARYDNPDNDPRGKWKPGDCSARNYYSEGTYKITCPGGRVLNGPPTGRYWTVSEENFWKADQDGRVWWGDDGNNIPAFKQFLSEVRGGRVPQTFWGYDEVGHTQDAKKELLQIIDFETTSDVFVTPKPTRLIQRVLDLATHRESLILDSFAGSGTTGHAVLQANKRDGGQRRFILVEMEDYADRLTAERVRRVIGGYDFKGTRKTELLREKITWSKLKNAYKLTSEVEKIENLQNHDFDAIKKTVKDGELIVTGEDSVTDQVDGLGGSFTYCTLGDPVELDSLLTGKALPPWEQLGAVLFNMATNRAATPPAEREADYYVGEADGQHVWLIYRPDLDWLKSPDAALTLSWAKEIAGTDPDARHLVFAPARYVSQKMLADRRIPVEFVPLPFALYRIDRS